MITEEKQKDLATAINARSNYDTNITFEIIFHDLLQDDPTHLLESLLPTANHLKQWLKKTQDTSNNDSITKLSKIITDPSSTNKETADAIIQSLMLAEQCKKPSNQIHHLTNLGSNLNTAVQQQTLTTTQANFFLTSTLHDIWQDLNSTCSVIMQDIDADDVNVTVSTNMIRKELTRIISTTLRECERIEATAPISQNQPRQRGQQQQQRPSAPARQQGANTPSFSKTKCDICKKHSWHDWQCVGCYICAQRKKKEQTKNATAAVTAATPPAATDNNDNEE
jgi:hypothetical protein